MSLTKITNNNDDYDPHLERNIAEPLTNFEAFVSLLKCAIGTGVMAMPRAMYNSGYLNGLISTAVIAIIVVYSLHIVIQGMYVMSKHQRVPSLSFRDSMILATQIGPPMFRCCSGFSGVMVDLFLALYHFGTCCVYVVFIADSMKLIFDYYDMVMDNRLYMAALTLPFILIMCIRELKRLVPYSIMANLFILFGFCIILYYVFVELPHISERTAFQRIEQYPLFFGTVLFALEAVGMVLSIEANCEKPKDFLGIGGILNAAYLVVTLIYAIIGFFGYWRYGEETKGSVSLNLPPDQVLAQVVQIMYALAIWITFALQAYVVVDVLWIRLLSKHCPETKLKKMEFVVRISIAVVAVFFAICIPNLGLFLSLVGAFTLSVLGIILPAFLDICVRYNYGYGTFYIYMIQDVLLILFGIVGGILGTYISLLDIIEYYQND